ncbi:hypothetical protein GGR57DRAFT_483805 [Xylariaceae sp. FL1272]|nr:hypothetical protein GGR57DRAFT_483805 [Xylariaceae sp. FL1272]
MAPKFQRGDSIPEPGGCGPEIVTLRATGGSKTFHVPARLLVHMSTYFEAALNSPFIEGMTYDFTLTEHCDDATLTIFTTWIHTMTVLDHLEYDIRESSFMFQPVSDIVRAWLFGDYIGAASFQNDMMLVMTDKPSRLWNEDVLDNFWSLVPINSKLDILFIDVLGRAMCDKEIAISYEDLKARVNEAYPAHVWEELTRCMVHRLQTGRWARQDCYEDVDDYNLGVGRFVDHGSYSV